MKCSAKQLYPLFFCTFLLVGLYFRASGLFHGLQEGFVFHPDTSKQVQNLQNGLEGNHIVYYGTLISDGYPYGLNRIDEAILRILRAVASPVYSLLNGEGESLPLPSHETLRFYTLLLRLLYGMITLCLIAKSTSLITRNRLAVLMVLALYSIAPLASTVTHFATGDIGADLFLCVTLFCLALHVRTPKSRYLFAAGLAVGMAFASKYHGALGAWIIAVYLLMLTPPFSKKNLPLFFENGLRSSFGFFLGFLVLTPGLWVDPAKNGMLIYQNFGFIKNYGAPPQLLELPAHTLALLGLRTNIPVVVQALGPLLILTSGFSLLYSLRKPFTRENSSLKGLWVASASFPFVTILLSTAMKPVVLPFHYSFLLVPLVFSAGLLFHAIQDSSEGRYTLPVCMWALVMFISSGTTALREDALWRKPPIGPIYRN